MSDFALIWRDSEYDNGYEHPRRLYPLIQRGGDRHVCLHVKEHPMTILETGDRITIVAYGGVRYSSERPCFRMNMNMKKRRAKLEDVNRFRSKACFEDGHHEGGDLVRAVYLLAQARGMRTIEYMDNSSKHCSPGGEVRLKLSDYYTLLEGKTWYESIFMEMGAVSVTPSFGISLADVLEYRQNAEEVSWDKMRGDIVSPTAIPAEIDTSAPGSARQVLRHLRSLDRPEICEFIGVNMTNFLANSHIKSVHSASWICVLPVTSSLTPSLSKRRRQTQRASSIYKRRTTLRKTHT